MTRTDRKKDQLSVDELTWVARCLCHDSDPKACRLAADLAMESLLKNPYHHASLLILAYILPKLPSYDDLEDMARRLPIARADDQEDDASIAHADSQLGRQGGGSATSSMS